MAEGPTPCVANGLAAGSYRVTVRDDRFEPLETVVSLDAGAMEDVTLAVTPRAAGAAARARRNPAVLVAAVVAAVAVAGALVVRPWGRTLDLDGLKARSAAGSVASARLAEDGVRGTLSVGPVQAPFRLPLDESALVPTLEELRAAGLDVDTTWEVARILSLAAEAQAAGRYFGAEGRDVLSHARRLLTLEPDSPEARSLVLKVAERMSWDADAAAQDGDGERANALRAACLEVAPGHPRCAPGGGGA